MHTFFSSSAVHSGVLYWMHVPVAAVTCWLGPGQCLMGLPLTTRHPKSTRIE